MKRVIKFLTGAVAASLILAGCSTNKVPTGTIGTIDDQEILVPYFSEIFKDVSETATNEASTENNETTTNSEESTEVDPDAVVYSVDSAVLVATMSEVFKINGFEKTDTKKLNRAVSNLKAQHGDDYLKEAEKTYQLPIRTEDDLIRILKFSLMYTAYLESHIDITDGDISKEYYNSHAKKYCATHVLVEDEADAKKMQENINNGKVTFDDYQAKARAIMEEEALVNEQEVTADTKLSINEKEIDGIKVKEFADLGCEPSSKYVGAFKDALNSMEANTVSSELVKTEYGFHIISLGNIETQELTETLQEEIRSSLISAAQREPGFQGHYLMQLINKVTIVMTNEEAKTSFDEYLTSLKEDEKSFVDESSTANNETETSTNNEATTDINETKENA